jgi:hypothetical protein
MGLLAKKADKYSNTEAAKTFLIKTSPGYMGFAVKHHQHLVSVWSKLSQAGKTGKPVRRKKNEESSKASHGYVQQRSGLAPRIIREIGSFSKATSF